MLYNPVSWINDATERNKEQQRLCSVGTVSVTLLWVLWPRWNSAAAATLNHHRHPSPRFLIQDTDPSAKGGVWELESSNLLTTDQKNRALLRSADFCLQRHIFRLQRVCHPTKHLLNISMKWKKLKSSLQKKLDTEQVVEYKNKETDYWLEIWND